MWKPTPDAMLYRSYLFAIVLFGTVLAAYWLFGIDLRNDCTLRECRTNEGFRIGYTYRPVIWPGIIALVLSVAVNGIVIDWWLRTRITQSPPDAIPG